MKMSKDINVVENFLSLVTGGEKQNLIKRRGVLACKAKESLVYGSALRVKRLCGLLYLYLWHCCQKCLGRCTPVWKCSTLKWLCLSFPRHQKHFNIVLVSGKCVKICQQYVIDLKMPYVLIIISLRMFLWLENSEEKQGRAFIHPSSFKICVTRYCTYTTIPAITITIPASKLWDNPTTELPGIPFLVR